MEGRDTSAMWEELWSKTADFSKHGPGVLHAALEELLVIVRDRTNIVVTEMDRARAHEFCLYLRGVIERMASTPNEVDSVFDSFIAMLFATTSIGIWDETKRRGGVGQAIVLPGTFTLN